MSRNVVIVGGSAAGPKVASKIRRLDPSANITIVQRGAYLSMASCGYPYYIGGVFDDRNKLISTPTGVQRDPTFFSNVKAIRAMVGTEVTAIDRDAKKVKVRPTDGGTEEELAYDSLVLTTGAMPVIPKLPGYDLEGITTLQSMEDADTLKAVAKEKKVTEAVIVGGGLIGIETCEALQLAGIKITVVEMLDQVLPFLDWELAKLVENHIRSKGSEVLTGTAVAEFLGKDGKIAGVKLADGREISCQLAVVSVGVRPNSELARSAGLKVGETGGISVSYTHLRAHET